MSKNPLEDRFHRDFVFAQAKMELLREFPDTIEVLDRWKNSYLSSKKANKRLNRIEVKATCDCCEGAPVHVYPYLEFAPGLRIYGNPHCFKIGKKIRKGVLSRGSRWEEQMGETAIPEEIYDLIWDYLEKNPPGPRVKKQQPEPDILHEEAFLPDPIPEDNFDYLQQLEPPQP